MTRYAELLDEKRQEIKQFDSEAYKLSDEDVLLLMGTSTKPGPVIKFYNEARKDIIAFKVSSVIKGKEGYILCIKTPNVGAKRIEGKSFDGKPKRTNMLGSQAIIYGEDILFGAWLEDSQWKQITTEYGKADGGSYGRVIFVHGGIMYQYHKIGDVWNADDKTRGKRKVGNKVILPLEKFLERHGLENIEQISKDEWTPYYKTNAWKVIL